MSALDRFYARLAGGRTVAARGRVPAHKGGDAPHDHVRADESGSAPSGRPPAGRNTSPPAISTPMMALARQIAEHPERHRPEARTLARLVLEATGDL